MSSLQVLVPTYNKTIEDIRNKCSFWNFETDALISVQSDHDEKVTFHYKEHVIAVIFNQTRGVSVNRNILIENCSADICIFIDDDCSMVNGYSSKIIDFYERNLCDCVCCNGFLPIKEKNILIHNTKTKKVARFHDISSVGAPGFSGKTSFLKSSRIRFDEKLGTPNFIVLGEDSAFVKNILDSGCSFYRFCEPVFKIEEDLENSSYFNGFGDYRFLISKGFVCKSIFKCKYFFVKFFHSIKLIRKNKLRLSTILRLYDIGASLKCKKRFKKLLYIDSNQKIIKFKFKQPVGNHVYFKLISDIYSSNGIMNVDKIISDENIELRKK